MTTTPIQGHLTSGTVVMGGGFEYYTFEVAMSGFEAMAQATDPMETLVGWYIQNPRPAKSEVVGIHDTKLNIEEKRVVITLKIQRGHYEIAKFLLHHSSHAYKIYNEDVYMMLVCDTCEYEKSIHRQSIPTLP